MKPKRKSPFKKGSKELDAEVDPSWTGPRNFFDYGWGYFNAGDLLARTIVNALGGKWKGWNLDDESKEYLVGDVYPDVLIFPLLGLYRQGTELMLKHFIYDKPNAGAFDEDAKKHRLLKLWEQAKQELVNIGFKEDSEECIKVQAFVEKLNELDPRGEAVRFPVDYLRNIFFENHAPINIESIFQEGREVGEILHYIAEGRNEILSEATEEVTYLEN